MNLTLLAILFANLVWGLSPILAKLGLQKMDELSFLLIRFALSTVFFLPLVLRAAKKVRRIPLQQLAMGVATVAVHYYLQVYALKQAPVTWYVFFYSLCPILSLFIVRVKLTWRLGTVGALALLGTWVFVDFTSSTQISWTTLGALCTSVVTWVLFTKSIQSWQQELTDAEISATTSALSFAIFAVLSSTNGNWNSSDWTLTAVACTVALSILLPIAFFAYSYSLRRNSGLAVLGQYSEPIFGTMGALFILGEQITIRQTAGLGLIAVALGLLILPKNFKLSLKRS